MNDKHLLELAIRAAKRGAEMILQVYENGFEVEYKDDKSPLTEADRRSHEVIASQLSDTAYPILSEEGKNIPYEERSKWQRFWLVDPLDGTKEFVKRNGEFTVNIALIENGIPVIGVILVPVSGRIYYAEMASGAFSASIGLDPAAGSELSNIRRLPDPEQLMHENYRIVCSRSHMSAETSEYIEGIRPLHPDLEFISIGSSLKLCLVAEGKADLYPRFGPTMEWDTAAGQAIVEISGGYVAEAIQGIPLRYNKENLLNPWFITGRK